jgi:hypothetical protein
MKKIINTFIFLLLIAVFPYCTFHNPYDRECPDDIWTPKNMTATPTNCVIELTWKQKVTHFDGYQIEKSTDSTHWQKVNSALIAPTDTIFTDTEIIPGKKVYYRIYGIADLNTSNFAYSKSVKSTCIPEVKTYCPTFVDSTSVTLNGECISDNGSPVIETGFYYSTSNITLDNLGTKVVTGSTCGPFTKTITGLDKKQTYYVKAFSRNVIGTGLGGEVSFATKFFTKDDSVFFKKYMPYYTGVNPPDILGAALVHPNTVVYPTGQPDEPDLKIRFIKDVICGTAYDFDSKQEFQGKSTEYTSVSNFIVQGSSNNFTCYFLFNGKSFGITVKKLYIISGTKTTAGLADLYIGTKLISKGADPQSLLPAAGTYRIYYDFLAEYTTWP